MKRSHYTALVLCGAFLLMIIAFYNGFPVTNSDDSSYIRIGMATAKDHDVDTRNDRTPFYGWFIYFASFGTSLWYVIFFQCLIVAFLLIKYICLLQKSVPDFNQAAISIIVITALTCVSWITSFLMPDIFGAILLLALILFLYSGEKGWVSKSFYLLIIFICVLIHNSHFMIVFLFSMFLLIQAIRKKYKPQLRKGIILVSVAVMGWVAICSENMALGNGFVFSSSGHVFMISRLCEMGILKTYLDDQCPFTKTKLCDYKKDLPVYEWDFMWDANSPLYKTGGWDSSKAEYSLIINYIMFHPKYLGQFVRKSAVGTLREVAKISISDHFMVQGKNTEAGYAITRFFPEDINENMESLQSNNLLSATTFNIFYVLFFLSSTFWMLFNRGKLKDELTGVYSFIVLFFVINAFVTSTFSTVVDRFQNRIFWLLPATNAILIVKYYYNKYSNRQVAPVTE